MKLPLDVYKSLVFDCDGIVLDSNKVKTDAFYKTTLPYGQAAAQAMVEYHTAHGGVSRYEKFAYFLEQIATGMNGPELQELLATYAANVRRGLLDCSIAPGLAALRRRVPNTRWSIVSGGDQAELRDVFSRRGIAELFDGGIFGSPDDKKVILEREIEAGNIPFPALFLGDSRYDFEAARHVGIDFLFISGWTEVKKWKAFVKENELPSISRLSELSP